RESGFVLSFWNEAGIEKEAVLAPVMRCAAAQRITATVASGWKDWDLDIRGGPTGRARVVVAAENHGADKRLLRVRVAPRPWPPAAMAVAALPLLALISAGAGGSAVAGILAALALGASGVAGWYLTLFARRLHGLVEEAAREVDLVPVDPVARAPLPVGPPRTA
ncbi:MAG: hypothetical protein JO258_03040, partial [Alphaproteobacteria bacterium]|nr:hypothetical protein [Alphaproteobacteria bacterium]